MSSGLEVRAVSGREELERFVRLPFELAARHAADQRPNAVPPLLGDERDLHDPEKNPALADSKVEHWLAWRDGGPVGRVMGIIHHPWNERSGDQGARFFQLACVKDAEVVKALLQAVEAWASAQGMVRIYGPFGFSDRDPQGLQVEGLEHMPVVSTPTNPDWLPPMVEALGYAPMEEMVSYRLEVTPGMAARFAPVAERCLAASRLRRMRLVSKPALRNWVVPVLRLVNLTYEDIFGFVPMKKKEMQALAEKYMFILDPELVELLVDEHNEPVAFVIAAPDMSEGLIKANGRLLPFGWAHILRYMRRAKQLDLLLGAVRPDLQGKGLTAVLALNLLTTAEKRGFTHLDSHLVMARNTRMCAQMERLGGKVWKRYRVFAKPLSGLS
ncbi:MAG: GNAT family N-acetyltransferase [Flavobacteriales bacterium]|nr:GNAT family N-acetyltransferase [Flavobacteriales bacterium]